MTAHRPVRRRLRLQAVLAFLTPLIIVAVVVFSRTADSIEPIEPVDLAATEPFFDSADALAEASDLVIVGTVIAVGPGRSISDPADPTAGIQTTVFEVMIDELVRGETVNGETVNGETAHGETVQADALTIEHETGLIDGTPITINGTAPPAIGDQAVFFLIAGDGENFPHFAINTTSGMRPASELEQLRSAGD